MRGICVLLIVMLGAGLTGIAAAGADETSKTLSPYFFVEGGDTGADHFPLKSTAVDAVITGVIADVRVTQEYANMGAGPINARYIFPVSTRAAVHGMRMTVGEEVIEAQIKERQVAKKVFTEAKTAGKNASLLEQERPNVFSMQVANIMPGETVAIELHYSELLVPEDGIYEFVYPTVVGPRYSTIPEAGAADHHQWLKSPFLTADRKPTSTFDIRVTLASGMTIAELACGSHATDVNWENPSRARICLTAGETHGGDRDFILDYRLDGDRIQSGLMLNKGQEENFFLLMVQPPRRVAPETMPPREYIFVLDVSGSMSGFPLDTAKLLMQQLLAGLRPVDRFNLILFAGSAQVLAPQSVPAQAPHIQAAMTMVDHQQGGGGTELGQALATGLGLPRSEGCARTMVVVTDGYIAAEKEVFGLIADQAGRCNVFAFGIGSSVNRYLIEGLARAGQGEPFVVTEPQAAADAAARFKSYIEAPVLTGIDLHFDGFDAYAVEPVRPADLFARRPLVICGKWRGRPQGTISLTGSTGDGPYEAKFDVARTAPSGDNGALSFLWARRRLSRLSDFTSREDDADTREQVTRLGLRYNLLTAHTSFVAVHRKVRNTGAPARDVDQPLPLPHNVSELAVGSRNMPEPGLGMLLAAAMAALLVMAQRKRRKLHASR
jgi:Ca-activated chloride channel family protein